MRTAALAAVIALLVAILGFTVGAGARATLAGPPANPTRCETAVRGALSVLRPEARAVASMRFDDAERMNWHFVPRERRGLSLKAMTADERRATHALLREVLSPRGYLTATSIVSLAGELRRIENGSGPTRDPLLYFLTVFGEPGPDGPWGVRFEGHHLSLNFTFDGDRASVTPLFLGANPAEVKDGDRAGLAPLAETEDLGHRLIASLAPEQRKAASFSNDAPGDILLGPGIPAVLPPTEGIAVAALDPTTQIPIVRSLVRSVTDVVAAPLDPDRARADATDLRFAFAGSGRIGEAWYLRVWCERWAIELDDVQNGANHVHLVWRDAADEFGARMIAEHRRSTRHEAH